MEKIVLIGAGGYCSGVIDSIEKKRQYTEENILSI